MARALTSQNDICVCSRSGVNGKLAKDELVTLYDLERTLKEAIRDADQAASADEWWGRGILIAKTVGTICDLAIYVLSEQAGKIPGAAPAAKAISLGYDVSKLVVDGFNGDITAKKGFMFAGAVHIDAIAEAFESAHLKPQAKALTAAKTLVATADDLIDFFREGPGRNALGRSGVRSAQATASRMLSRIQQQISDLEASLQACGDGLYSR
jgi:hypothetical protein